MESWWGSLLLLFLISEGALLHVQLEAIKGIVKTVSIFTCAFHGVVSQDVEIHISASHGGVLFVGDGDIYVQAEVFEGERLKIWSKSEYLHFWRKSILACWVALELKQLYRSGKHLCHEISSN